MEHLIIISDPIKSSFCHSILEKCINESKKYDIVPRIRDLYQLDFNPILDNADIESYSSGKQKNDVIEEQEIINMADFITFIYPIWWGGMPAIMKGYIDRIFSYGFAYTKGEKEPVGLLDDKNILLFSTHAAPKELYDRQGMYIAMNKINNDAIFNFVGAKVYMHKYYSSIAKVNQEMINIFLEDVESTLIGFLKK